MLCRILCLAIAATIIIFLPRHASAQFVIHGEQTVNFFASQGLTDNADSNLGYSSSTAIPDFSTNTISLAGLPMSINSSTFLLLELAGDFDQGGEDLGISVEGVLFGVITNSDVTDDRFDGGTGHLTENPFVGGDDLNPIMIPPGADQHPWGALTGFAGSGPDRQTFQAQITDTELASFLLDGVLDVQLTFFDNVGNGEGQIRVALASSAVPEPSSLTIMGIGFAAFATRRRRPLVKKWQDDESK